MNRIVSSRTGIEHRTHESVKKFGKLALTHCGLFVIVGSRRKATDACVTCKKEAS